MTSRFCMSRDRSSNGSKKSAYSNLSGGIAKFSPLQSKLFSLSVNT